MNVYQTLTRYKAWADELLFAKVLTLSHEQLIQPQPIIFGNLIRTVNHVYLMDYVWQCHLLGIPHGLNTRNSEQHPSIEALFAQQKAMNQWFVDYASTITSEQLSENVAFEFIGGGQGQMTRSDMILHVVNHATYHRGHVADMLYHMSVSPPTTDMPVFLRDVACHERSESRV